MKTQGRLTNAEIDYILKAAKFIFAVPNFEEQDGWIILRARVYKKDEPNWSAGSLSIHARVAKRPPGLPSQLPSCCLQWHGIRIRCVDREARHDNPDGTYVKGWHEHIWDDRNQDDRVIAAHPIVSHPSLRGIFQWGLDKWKIEVREKQLEVGSDERTD